ncbi:helix-turn-helix domain-containing protein [Amycolatopsis sp. NBC_00345]|uniref:PucR family transcriptional regulator n=1 Tax=Amycolatopsis sp. NBC_00345 TaxID=2975955 RepID=UPI002E267D1E
MNPLPHNGLGRVLDDLGATLLELVHGSPAAVRIGGVVIHDPLEDSVLPRHALVLGVGLREPGEVLRLVRELGRQEAVALVLRAPVPVPDELAAAADEAGVALLGLTRGASWAQLAALLRSSLAEIGDAGPPMLGGMPSGDLFALANAIAALIDAPVTIEDRESRVVAFSGRQDEADASRVETILGRQVPERFSRLLTERGVFRHLYRTDQPVHFEVPDEQTEGLTVARVAVAVRAGDELLGSIWAAVREPLSEDRGQALVDAARLVALHLLRIRAGADVERRLRTELLGTALEGGAGAREALNRLGVADQPVVVLALALPGGDGVVDAGHVTARQRLSDSLALHLSAVHPRSAAALVGDVVYGLIPVGHSDIPAEERGVRIAGDFLDRLGERAQEATAVAAVGPVARDVAELAVARENADRTLRVLCAGHARGLRVARLADVHAESLVLELRDIAAARGDRPTGAVARLLAYDEQHNTGLVETLRAWLDAFGDVVAAAAAVHVHPNTFRYRLRRLAEVGDVDLADPDARFAALLQLRLL